jgi:hypothetical protein
MKLQFRRYTLLLAPLTVLIFFSLPLATAAQQANPSNLLPCPREPIPKWHNCWGTEFDDSGAKYAGEFKDGNRDGQGTYTDAKGDQYVGGFKKNKFHGQGTYTTTKGDKYIGEYLDGERNGQGTATFEFGGEYAGEWKDGKLNGKGMYAFALGMPNSEKYVGDFKDGKRQGHGKVFFGHGDSYVGQWVDNKIQGRGIYTTADGRRFEGIFQNGKLIREEKVNVSTPDIAVAENIDRSSIELEQKQPGENEQRSEQNKREREQKRQSQRIDLQITYSKPSDDGSVTFNIQTNTDTASLLINGFEEGGRADGKYILKRMARAGQETKFTITATDINGNKDTKIIAVTREVVELAVKYDELNPGKVKKQPEGDAVAVIIGIGNYKSLPLAEFANDDARAFYDYAVRALGVKPANVKLLVDTDAEEAEIIKAFRTWLPSRVRPQTDVYVFYSGHGLPTPDGSGLYLLPQRADREVIDDTAIPFSKINTAIEFAKPRSVTFFLDACYSGQSRTGQALVASARPVALKSQSTIFPPNFTVIAASQGDQISSSSPDLRHGIFSYYLMKGMEGDADLNKDEKITFGEMQSYLTEQVRRQAGMMSRKQEPQLVGDANRVLVGR